MLSNSIVQSNLAIALYLLPRTRRRDALFFYNFCHTIDECVDGSSLTLFEKEKFLETAPLRLEELIQHYHLDRKLINELIHGMKMDLTINRYGSFEELYCYAWRVASTVGLISVELFGASGTVVQEYAEQLGVALQLTNILRDIAEDAARGRIYLPLEDMNRFSVTEKEILTQAPRPQAIHLFDYEAERALSYFAKANLAWNKMPPHQRSLMRPARLMESIYRSLLEKMQHDRYDLFNRRYHVGIFEKIALALHTYFSH